MLMKFVGIPCFKGYILLLLAVTSFAAEYKYHVSQTNISVNADQSSASFIMGKHEFRVSFPEDVDTPAQCGDDTICIGWGKGDGPILHLKRDTSKKQNMWKLSIHNTAGGAFKVDLNGDTLFGGPVGKNWPANLNEISATPYVTGDGSMGAVAEKYWFTSSGMALNVDFDGHLFLTQNNQQLLFEFQNKVPYPSTNITIKINICLGENARDAFACFPQKPRKIDKKMMKDPIWSTWVRYKTNISQEKVINFANEIRDNGFTISTMEIDDKWETCYGNHQWDKKKFPNPKAMVSELKARGMYVTLWVHPFINVECEFFKEAEPYLYKLPDGSVGVTEWWNGKGGLIDFTNKTAVEWFKRRLQALKEDVGLTGFKFDAGEASYIPGLLQGETIVPVPNEYTNEYVKMAASFGVMGEVRVGANNMNTPIYQRLQDTNTCWNASCGGLRSIIPSVLTLNTLGYPAVLPDMVGGNLYSGQIDKELFIRWMELNFFLPVIQFSIPPWTFDNETTRICQGLSKLHSLIGETFAQEIEKGEFEDGHRVISPVWWYSPEDKTALTISDEFLIGKSILVAPVLEKGVRSRDVYLPSGHWFEPFGATPMTTYKGPTLLKNHHAPLGGPPFFLRMPSI